MKRKLLLFDLDGTLLSTTGAGLRALKRAFHELYQHDDGIRGIDPSGKTDPAIFREMVKTHHVRDMDSKEMQTLAATYLKHLENEMAQPNVARVLTGVRELLERLSTMSDRVAVGLGTGNLEKGARLKLEPAGLNKYFSFGGFGSDAEDRAHVLKAGQKKAETHVGHTIDPRAVYIIGDTPLDVAAARRAGFWAVAVASGTKTMDDLRRSEPDFLIKDMTDASHFLDHVLEHTYE